MKIETALSSKVDANTLAKLHFKITIFPVIQVLNNQIISVENQ
jgi:hypothetical protein